MCHLSQGLFTKFTNPDEDLFIRVLNINKLSYLFNIPKFTQTFVCKPE